MSSKEDDELDNALTQEEKRNCRGNNESKQQQYKTIK